MENSLKEENKEEQHCCTQDIEIEGCIGTRFSFQLFNCEKARNKTDILF